MRRAGDAISLADLLDNAGYLALIDGEHEQARILLDEAVTASRASSDVVGLAYAVENRAMLAVLEEEWDRAVALLREVFELCDRHAVTAPLPEALAGAAANVSVRESDPRPSPPRSAPCASGSPSRRWSTGSRSGTSRPLERGRARPAGAPVSERAVG